MLIAALSFLGVFTIVALVHEIGHYIWARRAGIRVYEFGVGLGPKIFSLKRNEVLFSLRLFPVGAFVQLAGDEEEDNEEARKCPIEEKFFSKTALQRFKAIAAGPFLNLLLAYIIFVFIFFLVGVPVGLTKEIETINPGSPAQRAGLQSGDMLLSIDGTYIHNMEEAISMIHKSSGKELTLKIKRENKFFEIKATPEYDSKLKVGLLGFAPKYDYEKLGFLAAVVKGVKELYRVMVSVLLSLFLLITGKASIDQVMGPVGIAQLAGRVARNGFLPLVQFTGLLSAIIGTINLLPIPALDGGRLFFLLVEVIRRKPIDQKKEAMIHSVGLIILLVLLALITFNDLRRIFFS